MQYTYESHMLDDKLLPFVYHIDRVTSMTVNPPNYHANIELLFCIEGSGQVICGAQKYDFTSGDIIVINSNTLHKVVSDNLVRYYCLIVDEKFCVSNGIDISKLNFDVYIADDRARDAYRAVCKAYASVEDAKVVAIRYAVLGLLLILVRFFSKPVDANAQRSDYNTARRIKKTIEFIRSNLNSTLTLDDISDFVGISKFHLSRDFKKFTGNTIFEFINILRCQTAATLIAGGMTVSAAAGECGFENLSYFSRTYKKYIGKLPSQKD